MVMALLIWIMTGSFMKLLDLTYFLNINMIICFSFNCKIDYSQYITQFNKIIDYFPFYFKRMEIVMLVSTSIAILLIIITQLVYYRTLCSPLILVNIEFMVPNLVPNRKFIDFAFETEYILMNMIFLLLPAEFLIW